MPDETVEPEKQSTRGGALAALGLMLVVGLVLYGWVQREEINEARAARQNEEWEQRVRAEETRQRQVRANAWRDVRLAKARWDELYPWVKRTAALRQQLLTGAAGLDWLLSDGNAFDLFGLAIGAGAIEATNQVLAEATAEIQMKGPEVIAVVVEMDDAVTAMLEADAALPGDEQAIAAFQHAKEVGMRWAEAGNAMQLVMAQDFFSAGASADRFNEATAEFMAALQDLMPGRPPSNDGAP